MIRDIFRKYKALPIAVRAAFWFTVCNAMSQGVNFLTMPFLTRLMSNEQYGILTTYNSWLAILLCIVALNIYGSTYNTAMVKFEEKEDSLFSATFGLLATLAVSSFVILFYVRGWAANVTGLDPIFLIMIPINICVTSEFALWTAHTKFKYNYITLLWVTALYIILPAFISILSVYLWPNAEQKAIIKILSQLSITLPIIVCIGIKGWIRGKHFYLPDIWRYLILFSVPLLPHYLSMMILGQSDRIMISSICGKPEAAYYAVSYQISVASSIVITAINQAVIPWLYKELKKNDSNNNISTVVDSVSVIAASISFILTSMAPEIISFFAPESYREAMYLIPAISGSTYFTYLYGMCVNVELYYEKKRYTVIITMIASILNVILNLVLLPKFGYVVAAYTTIVCYIIMGLGHTIATNHISSEKSVKLFNYRWMWTIACILVVSNQLLVFVYNKTLIRYIIILLFVIAIFNNRKLFTNLLSIRNK